MSDDLFRCITMDPNWQEHGGGGRSAENHYDTASIKEIWRSIVTAPEWRPHPNGCHLWMWFTAGHTLEAHSLVDRLGFRYVSQGTWVKASEAEVAERWQADKEFCAWMVSAGYAKKIKRQITSVLSGLNAIYLWEAWSAARVGTVRPQEPGLGQYMRFLHEPFLLATRGKAMMPEKGTQPTSVLLDPDPMLDPESVLFAPTAEHSAKPDLWYERYPGKVSPGPRLAMFERKLRPGFTVHGHEAPKE